MRQRACWPPRLSGQRGLPPPAALPGIAGAPGTRRWLALHLPDLPTDRLTRRDPTLLARPLALWAAEASARRLVAVNAAGRAVGLAVGKAVADAQAMLPDLVLLPADPVAEAALLTTLAAWARRFTPLASTAPPDGLLLDITGAAHLAGGEAALLDQARGHLARAGFAVWAAIAGTPAAAGALARAGRESIVPPGKEAEAIAALPLHSFRLDAEAVAAFARFGLLRAGDALAQPRAGLVRRLGPEALAALDAALGRHAVPTQPVPPDRPARAELACPEPLLTADALAIGIDRLAATLCADLHAAGIGARALALDCRLVDDTVQRIDLGLGTASRDPAHLARLLRGRIDRIDPGFGIAHMALAATRVEELGAAQGGLPGSTAAAATRQETLAPLLDRLAQRLGRANVFVRAPVASHIPHRAARAADPHALLSEPPPGWAARPRPVRLLTRPSPLTVIALSPAGPPAAIGRQHVLRAEGPERIGGEWWDEDVPDEDYWRVEIETGARLWIARRGEDWTLRGYFP